MFDKSSPLFKDPQVDHPIHDPNLPFADYIQKTRAIIEQTRVDLNNNLNAERIIEANSPFELYPDHPTGNQKIKYGALLIHGLFDSPIIMRDIGEFLKTQGILARGILLPGHGTVPGALLNIDYHDWLQAVHYGIETLAREVDHIFLVGYSTGASLAIYHAKKDPRIAGLILTSPAFKIRSSIDFTANWHRIISWAWERAKWVHIGKDNDYAKYQSFAFNAVYQVYRLTKEIKKMNSGNLKCPMLMALSQDDKTVSPYASLKYFKNLTNIKNRLILYGNQASYANDARILRRGTAYPELHINSFCHVSIPIAPTNPHYGASGDYVFASRVYENLESSNPIVYGGYNKAEETFYTFFLYKLKLMKHRRQRLTFNPDFNFLMQEITRFIINI